MDELPTLRQRAEEGARVSLCVHDRTDGFCGGRDPGCKHCVRLGGQIGVDVLRHIRPTMKRLLEAKGQLLCVEDVLGLIDEAVDQRPVLPTPGIGLFEETLLAAQMRLIHELRADEGNSVLIPCDNPDFQGPNVFVEVCADWTDWTARRFDGDTLHGALSAAVTAARKAREVADG